MNRKAVEQIARAVLYEGYLLYPYRPSAMKNRMRWNFGVLYPPAFAAAQTGSDRAQFVLEVIALAEPDAAVEAEVRFLQLSRHEPDGWEVGREKSVEFGALRLGSLLTTPFHRRFSIPTAEEPEYRSEALEGEVEIAAAVVDGGAFRVRLSVSNTTAFDGTTRDAALLRSLASAHAVLGIVGGEFVSMVDPPEPLRPAVEACRNEGVWPVLAGDPAKRDTMLGSPIILEDYARVAPESPGDLFDGTEIDEILTLRVLTLSEAEKAEIRAAGGRGREILERAEALSAEDLGRLHGAIRELRPVLVEGTELRPGDRVRLKPSRQADVMDMVLAGKVAIVESIETDFEGRVHLAVVVEDDPGRDLGEMRQSGHRFFFSPSEVQPVGGSE